MYNLIVILHTNYYNPTHNTIITILSIISIKIINISTLHALHFGICPISLGRNPPFLEPISMHFKSINLISLKLTIFGP